ncbi:hypothetical protein [Sphingomonas aracearum]|uniref:hypothetical protein n=1 Tax=Sphingomonas aracearum TaxID=2283317 RepID=UPI0015F03747|nr:hypothetical protein [Sphingomonas aracearum]
MKLLALAAAGLLAGSAIAVPAPAEAQRFHHREYGRHPGWHGPRPGYGYGRPYRWRGGPRPFYRSRYYGRPRTVCRVRHGYYGPVRHCYRVR